MDASNGQSDRLPMLPTQKTPNTLRFISKNLCFNWVSSISRLALIIIVFSFSQYLMIHQNAWAFLFYLLLALIDVISLIGEINTYQFLQKERRAIRNIEDQKQRGVPVTDRVRIGRYSIYLSEYETLWEYKFRYKPTASSYGIIRYMHVVTSFAIFGALALRNAQGNATTLQVSIISVILLSVYLVNFEADYVQLENSEGKYQVIESMASGIRNQVRKKFVIWRKIVAGTLFCLLIMLSVGLAIPLSISNDYAEIWGLIAVIACSITVTVVSICYQFFLIKKASDSNGITHPNHIQKVCNHYHLLYEIKYSHKKFFLFLTSSLRILLFSLYMTTMYYSTLVGQDIMWILLSCTFVGTAAEIVKFVYGHLAKIDYFCAVELTNQQKIDKSCSICLSNYVDNPLQVELPCSAEHAFHKSCLLSWMQNKKQCPLCRYDLQQFTK